MIAAQCRAAWPLYFLAGTLFNGKPDMQVVWFKRDLRSSDHRALVEAARRGRVLPLYVAEPGLWQQPDMAARHWQFISESLNELRTALARAGQPLVVRVGEITEVLNDLRDTVGITALWSHEETGNSWTYARDRRVAAWCREAGIPWLQVQHYGVQRRLHTRDGWSTAWERFMSEDLVACPDLARVPIEPGHLPTARDLGLAPDPCPARQKGGRGAGLDLLNSFLTRRGETYRRDMSSPSAGAHACSRLSPHLAWGTLSVREVSQGCRLRQQELRAVAGAGQWRQSLHSFSGRLHWHCHFIQKLEDEPRLEFENLHSAYDGVRPSAPDTSRLLLWEKGETGLPFLDACMRSLRATGWLNFRMRAMVVAVASYHLWLHWRTPGEALARLFTDFEPGIHWSQMQMQSGTTGINTVRIYNPIKQGYDQDPSGVFTRNWVPELSKIPDRFLHEPWKADNASEVLGRAYPWPVVDHVEAARAARDRIWAVRHGVEFRAEADAIQQKHGSRRSGLSVPAPSGRRRRSNDQLELPFGGGT